MLNETTLSSLEKPLATIPITMNGRCSNPRRPPNRDTLISILQRNDVCHLGEICAAIDKPSRVVLPVLREVGELVEDKSGWRLKNGEGAGASVMPDHLPDREDGDDRGKRHPDTDGRVFPPGRPNQNHSQGQQQQGDQ